MGGQIPNTPLPESPCDFTAPEPVAVSENGSASGVCQDDAAEGMEAEEVCSQDVPSGPSTVSLPVPSAHLASPSLGFSVLASLDTQGKGALPALALQRQSSRENSSLEGGDTGPANDSSLLVGDQECQSRSPDATETMCYQAVSPANSQAGSVKSRSPEGHKAEGVESCRVDTEGDEALDFL